MSAQSSSSGGQTVVGIYGAGGPTAGDNETLEALVTDMGGLMFKANQEAAIIDHIMASKGNDVVLIGYSRGGNAAVNVANSLGRQGVNIKSLITFDPHRLTGGSFSLNYNNVGQAFNYYQQNPRTGGAFGWWGSNPYNGSPITSQFINVNQTNFTGSSYSPGVPVSHLNIIRHSLR